MVNITGLRDVASFILVVDRGQLKCDGTRVETRFRLSAKRSSPFKSSGASVQSNTGSRGMRISGSNAGYTMFRGIVKSTGYPLDLPVSPHFPCRASPCVITFQLESTSLSEECVVFVVRVAESVCGVACLSKRV